MGYSLSGVIPSIAACSSPSFGIVSIEFVTILTTRDRPVALSFSNLSDILLLQVQ